MFFYLQVQFKFSVKVSEDNLTHNLVNGLNCLHVSASEVQLNCSNQIKKYICTVLMFAKHFWFCDYDSTFRFQRSL